MSARPRGPTRSRSLRQLATRALESGKVATRASVDLDTLGSNEMHALIHELEVHKVELEIQNEQLRDAQLAVNESRDRYRRLYDSAPIGFLTLDPDGAIVEANLAAAGLMATPRSRLIGRTFSRFVARCHQDRWHLELRALARRARRIIELELTRPDGSALQAQLVSSGAQGRGAARESIPVALMDVTELRALERALRAAASAASMAEQNERRKLASDLHDDAGQLVSLALIKLRALGDGLAGEKDAQVHELDGILSEVRTRLSSLSFQLNPPMLHDLGLAAAARWLAEDLAQRYGLVVQISAGEELELGEVGRVALFRAMRELLINVTKHAGVGDARVRIWQEGRTARVAVEDAGIGFGPDAELHGFGLLALRERLEQLGGSLELGSVMGAGTRGVASVPFDHGAGGARAGARP